MEYAAAVLVTLLVAILAALVARTNGEGLAQARGIRGAGVVAMFAALLTAGSCATAPHDIATATVDGHRVAYRVLGTGRPVVVMISGLGDGMESFRDVAPEIAKFATVITYDRAGYGGIDRASRPRDAEAAERELAGLLSQSGVRGPYVVLGHSLGGTFAEFYAAKHPDQVSALILEETRPADFTRRCESAKAGMCVAPALATRFMPVGAQDEYGALAATMKEVETIEPMKNKPVLVLSRAIEGKAAPFDVVWAAAQNDLAARYAGSRHSVVESGHYIHRDQRDWFVASLREFLAK
jgi:pimeloyl-ACP methyl ester carboxylesterase